MSFATFQSFTSWNCCSDEHDSLHLALPGNVHLKENQQKLTDADVEVLESLLSGNTYITSLDLRYNRITDSGAKALAQVIKVTGVGIRLQELVGERDSSSTQ